MFRRIVIFVLALTLMAGAAVAGLATPSGQLFWFSLVERSSLARNSVSFNEFLIDTRARFEKPMADAQFRETLDASLATWTAKEIKRRVAAISTDTLMGLTDTAVFYATPLDPDIRDAFPKATTAVAPAAGQITPAVQTRVAELFQIATSSINEMGRTHADVAEILETGFALATEFEDYEYADEAATILQATFSRVEAVLKNGLDEYRATLKAATLTPRAIAALKTQLASFEELGSEFEGYAPYIEAARNALTPVVPTACDSVMRAAKIDVAPDSHSILVGQQNASVKDFACALFENGHILMSLSGDRLEIELADGKKRAFQMEARPQDQKAVLIGTAQGFLGLKKITAAQWAELSETLAYIPPSGKPDTDGITECDRLAADPMDPDKKQPGVDLTSQALDPRRFDRAVDACVAAVEFAPEERRLSYQLARLLWHSGDVEGAQEFAKRAAANESGAAMFLQAEADFTQTDEDSFHDGIEHLQASASRGYPPAKKLLNELIPPGTTYFRPLPNPTATQVASAFPPMERGFMGIIVVSYVRDAEIRSCFQTGPRVFSCEYRVRTECDANEPFVRAMLQASCGWQDYEFGDFRVTPDGRWSRS